MRYALSAAVAIPCGALALAQSINDDAFERLGGCHSVKPQIQIFSYCIQSVEGDRSIQRHEKWGIGFLKGDRIYQE